MSRFKDGKCIDCGKTIEEIYYELLESENEEVMEVNYRYIISGHFSEYSQRSVVERNHQDCLTPDERIIKDIIE